MIMMMMIYCVSVVVYPNCIILFGSDDDDDDGDVSRVLLSQRHVAIVALAQDLTMYIIVMATY